jgi:hypothetical protein
VSLSRTFISTGAHRSVANPRTVTCGGAWRVTELAAKLSGEMSIVAKAAGVGNFAGWLVFSNARRCRRRAA